VVCLNKHARLIYGDRNCVGGVMGLTSRLVGPYRVHVEIGRVKRYNEPLPVAAMRVSNPDYRLLFEMV